MDELVRWLGEQLDEDERALRAGLDAAVPPSGHVMQDRVLFGGLDRGVPEPIMDAYVRFGDPARVLREIDAKRDLLVFAKGIHDHHATFTTGVAARLEKALRLFALAYADRVGYREEWAP